MADDAAVLTFRVDNVYAAEILGDRAPSMPTPDQGTVDIWFGLTRSAYTEQDTQAVVECEYRATIKSVDEADDTEYSHLRARVAVVMTASRPMTPEDAENDRLEPARDLAIRTAHPYLRQHLRQLSLAMGIANVEVPVDVDDVLRAPEQPDED